MPRQSPRCTPNPKSERRNLKPEVPHSKPGTRKSKHETDGHGCYYAQTITTVRLSQSESKSPFSTPLIFSGGRQNPATSDTNQGHLERGFASQWQTGPAAQTITTVSYTLHPAPCTRNLNAETRSPQPETPHSKPGTRNSKHQTPNTKHETNTHGRCYAQKIATVPVPTEPNCPCRAQPLLCPGCPTLAPSQYDEPRSFLALKLTIVTANPACQLENIRSIL